jgi:hypothetical protein
LIFLFFYAFYIVKQDAHRICQSGYAEYVTELRRKAGIITA